MKIWGLTGGVASGKSTAAKFFKQAGIPVVDADAIARELSQKKGAAYPAILKRFGTADRKKLRKLVFSNEAARKDLEAILHPLIQAESKKRISALSAPHVIYEAALLVEKERYKDLAGLIVIDAPRELRKKRLIERNKISASMAEQILDSQISDEARRAAATAVIQNSGTLEELREKITYLIVKLFK